MGQCPGSMGNSTGLAAVRQWEVRIRGEACARFPGGQHVGGFLAKKNLPGWVRSGGQRKEKTTNIQGHLRRASAGQGMTLPSGQSYALGRDCPHLALVHKNTMTAAKGANAQKCPENLPQGFLTASFPASYVGRGHHLHLPGGVGAGCEVHKCQHSGPDHTGTLLCASRLLLLLFKVTQVGGGRGGFWRDPGGVTPAPR